MTTCLCFVKKNLIKQVVLDHNNTELRSSNLHLNGVKVIFIKDDEIWLRSYVH